MMSIIFLNTFIYMLINKIMSLEQSPNITVSYGGQVVTLTPNEYFNCDLLKRAIESRTEDTIKIHLTNDSCCSEYGFKVCMDFLNHYKDTIFIEKSEDDCMFVTEIKNSDDQKTEDNHRLFYMWKGLLYYQISHIRDITDQWFGDLIDRIQNDTRPNWNTQNEKNVVDNIRKMPLYNKGGWYKPYIDPNNYFSDCMHAANYLGIIPLLKMLCMGYAKERDLALEKYKDFDPEFHKATQEGIKNREHDLAPSVRVQDPKFSKTQDEKKPEEKTPEVNGKNSE